MFVYKLIFLGTLIVNTALSEEINDDIQVNVHRSRQLPTYSYNHPPLFDASDDIFIQKQIVRQEKSIELTTPEPMNDNKKEVDSVGSLPKDLENNAQAPISGALKADDTAKALSSPNGKPKKRKQRRRQQGSNNNSNKSTKSSIQVTEDKESLITTLKPIEIQPVKASTVASHDVTLFPKRPIEDSKRIEFQKRSRTQPPVVKILDAQNFVYAHTGNFHYSYDSADGTKVSSMGELRNVNQGTGEAVVGSVSYTDQDGNDYNLSYTADENGYRPVGAHLPTPPPIPPAIARALRYLATKTPEDVTASPFKKV